ncbi:hypothetical protein SynBIOSE41_03839 [Synechococcus sp. BIOS-E4-1]|nr:hypothetical protein SynBIOSE41_03839 [Synechococcus sp. BIOS-E4-1]
MGLSILLMTGCPLLRNGLVSTTTHCACAVGMSSEARRANPSARGKVNADDSSGQGGQSTAGL